METRVENKKRELKAQEPFHLEEEAGFIIHFRCVDGWKCWTWKL